MEKLGRLMRHAADTSDRAIVFRPGSLGMSVRIFVDVAYGEHADRKSHTGSCVVIEM